MQTGLVARAFTAALVLATGARHSYFGNESWSRFAHGLKSLEDATEIRRRILIAFEKASVIGIRTSAGKTLVHPAMTTKILDGDSVIAIAADDDQVKFTGIEEGLRAVSRVRPNVGKQSTEHLLVIGWSQMGNTVLSELAPFLPKGSSVTIIANPDLISKDVMPKKTYGSIKTSFQANKGTISELAAVARKKKYDEIIVLAYREKIAVSDADARTMLTMLLLSSPTRSSESIAAWPGRMPR